MKKETIKNIYIALLTIFTAISLILITIRINDLEARVKYIDNKRIEYENRIEDLETQEKMCEFSQEILNEYHNKWVD